MSPTSEPSIAHPVHSDDGPTTPPSSDPTALVPSTGKLSEPEAAT